MQKVYGVKFDLMISSGFMEGLFNSPMCPPTDAIEITDVEPKIFKMIIE
jgi:hypothetical protein